MKAASSTTYYSKTKRGIDATVVGRFWKGTLSTKIKKKNKKKEPVASTVPDINRKIKQNVEILVEGFTALLSFWHSSTPNYWNFTLICSLNSSVYSLICHFNQSIICLGKKVTSKALANNFRSQNYKKKNSRSDISAIFVGRPSSSP